MSLSGQLQTCSFFFLRKKIDFTKTRHRPKPTNKTKLSEQKITNVTIFDTQQKLVRG